MIHFSIFKNETNKTKLIISYNHDNFKGNNLKNTPSNLFWKSTEML